MREQTVAQIVYDNLEFLASTHNVKSPFVNVPLRFLRSAYYNNVGLISYEMGERCFLTLPILALARFNARCDNPTLHTGFGSESVY
jgi:hypothetical protein